MTENTRHTIHNRMRWIHAWLVEHADSGDHRGGSDEGCACTNMYEEMKSLWLKLNPNATVVWSRAGPNWGGSTVYGRLEGNEMLGDVRSEDSAFLRNTELQKDND